ncbi:hypothetical protein J1N35_037828 [Gossypium stocksii]|uniref:Uncharacterized protein n=1 Tax=Gossypium stocksii TaxID=47602 RepID=A0A9D3ZM16_9ROSI|nr:hypothetical protein J1N35_037828 [Gossypium stocksii]
MYQTSIFSVSTMSSSVYEVDRIDERATEDQHTKKVRLKEQQAGLDVGEDMDMSSDPNLSWKDRLLGKGKEIDDFNLSDKNIKKATINGIPSIEFLDINFSSGICLLQWC